MKGATALPLLNTMRPPIKAITIKIGVNQYLRRALMNRKNSTKKLNINFTFVLELVF